MGRDRRAEQEAEGIHILKGTECDILEDGSLDYDDELLAGFDYVVASVHTYFDLTEEEQTARVCKALAHPRDDDARPRHRPAAAPPRRLQDRPRRGDPQPPPKHGKMIEINAQPSRLDLDWTYVKRAKALGVTLVINPDAHAPASWSCPVRRGRGPPRLADEGRRVQHASRLAEVVAELKRRKG